MGNEDMLHGEEFDYVIVGGGAAGCVLAHRLSARADIKVLLLEAGGSDATLNVRIPAAFAKLFRTARDWAYETAPEAELGGRRLFWPRGKMLGGSSSMNAQMYVRGHPADYDGWAQAGCTGWSYDDVKPAFARAERRADDAYGLYGKDGPQHVGMLRDANVTTAAFLDACSEVGLRRLRDVNEPENEGAALTPVTQYQGQRFSAADAYLAPARSRPNLRVVVHATAERVVFEEQRAVAVVFRDARGNLRSARARREVILAAGAIGSPKILLASGVGAASQLQPLGIDVVANLPGVGENLQDHLLVAVIRNCDRKVTLVHAEAPLSLLNYFTRKRGMLTSNVGEALAFVRSDSSLPAPDVELIWAPVPYIDHGAVKPAADGTTIGIVLLQPESRGRIRLASKDPSVPPHIEAGYLTDAGGKDLARLIHGVRRAQQIYAAPALKDYNGTPLEPGPDVHSDADVAEFIRQQAETLYHPVGTCRMGTDEGAVVDPTLRVRLVQGLRVVDASVMPRINRGHTYAPTVMIAERASEMILADATADWGAQR